MLSAVVDNRGNKNYPGANRTHVEIFPCRPGVLDR